jgi:gas vesicle protein
MEQGRNTMIRTGKVLLGIFFGAVVGTLLGVLMAPPGKSIPQIKVNRESTLSSDDSGEKYGEYAIL